MNAMWGIYVCKIVSIKSFCISVKTFALGTVELFALLTGCGIIRWKIIGAIAASRG